MKKIIAILFIVIFSTTIYASGRGIVGLPITGGTMQGNIDMDSNDITNVDNMDITTITFSDNTSFTSTSNINASTLGGLDSEAFMKSTQPITGISGYPELNASKMSSTNTLANISGSIEDIAGNDGLFRSSDTYKFRVSSDTLADFSDYASFSASKMSSTNTCANIDGTDVDVEFNKVEISSDVVITQGGITFPDGTRMVSSPTAGGGGGGNLNDSIIIMTNEFMPATTNGAELEKKAGTNKPVWMAHFDGATDETVYFAFIMKSEYDEGAVTISMPFRNAVAGNLAKWDFSFSTMTAFGDWDSGFGNTYSTSTQCGFTTEDVSYTSLTITSPTSIDAGKLITGKLIRDASADSNNGDCSPMGIEIKYTKNSP